MFVSTTDGEKVLFFIREFREDDFSLAVKIWNPQKKIYEHPHFIRKTKGEALAFLDLYLSGKEKISLAEIIASWEYVGS